MPERIGIGLTFATEITGPRDRRILIRVLRRALLKRLWVSWWQVPHTVDTALAEPPLDDDEPLRGVHQYDATTTELHYG